MREIITLQIGPFANWAGSHFWNVQDDARHPASYDDAGDEPPPLTSLEA